MQTSSRKLFQTAMQSLNVVVEKYWALILGALLTFSAYQKWNLILRTDGGGDLLGADIPKSMLLVAGQNPYLSNPWASPYPPFLLAVVGAVIRITSGTISLSPVTIGLISRNIRTVGLIADASVAILIFLGLRARGVHGFGALVPPAIFLTLPSISISPYYWFNSDLFGYPILAGSVLCLFKNRYFLGSMLLSVATIFKIHPLLAIPLVLVWVIRKQGLSKSIPSVLVAASVLCLGLVVPIFLPGYLGSIVGFNLSSGFGGGTSSFTMMNLLYTVLPATFNISLQMAVENQIWAGLSAMLFVIAFGIVWRRGRFLTPVDVATIGLLVWLIPLRQIYTHYLVWAVVPFLMRGRLSQSIIVSALLEFANSMASWSWGLPPDPFPVLATPIGFMATSLAYFSVGATALSFLLKPAVAPTGRVTQLAYLTSLSDGKHSSQPTNEAPTSLHYPFEAELRVAKTRTGGV